MGSKRGNGILLWTVRYALPGALILAGVVLAVVIDGSLRWDGFAMCVGAGLAVALLNLMFRIGAKGDEERAAEDAAREYLSQHGHWPDEPPPPRRELK